MPCPVTRRLAFASLAVAVIGASTLQSSTAQMPQKSQAEMKRDMEAIEETQKILKGPPMKMAEELANCAGVLDAASYVMGKAESPNAATTLRELANGYAVSAIFVVKSYASDVDANKWVESLEGSAKTLQLAAVEINQPQVLRDSMQHCREVVQPISVALTDEIRNNLLYKKSPPIN